VNEVVARGLEIPEGPVVLPDGRVAFVVALAASSFARSVAARRSSKSVTASPSRSFGTAERLTRGRLLRAVATSTQRQDGRLDQYPDLL
jgi:hypothetical protein